MKYENYTLYGIHNKTERQLLVGYKSLITISCLIGDTIILVGSLRYKAIKLHKILVIFIQYIAVADLLVTVFNILPGAVSLAANGWILGDIVCYLGFLMNVGSAAAISFLMSALALSKMLIVKYPLKAILFSRKAAHLSACSMWVYSFIFPVIAIVNDRSGVYFSYMVYNCDYSSSRLAPATRAAFSIVVGISLFTSTAVTVVSSVVLVVLAKRVADRGPGGLQWQGVLTVLLTVMVHTLINLPLSIFYLIQHYCNTFYLYRYGWYIAILGVVVNFYIFTLTLTSFREFLKSGMRMLAAPLMICSTAREDERSLLQD